MCCVSSAELNAFSVLQMSSDSASGLPASCHHRIGTHRIAPELAAILPTVDREQRSTNCAERQEGGTRRSSSCGSTRMKLSKSVAAFIDVMLWPFIWAAAEIKALGEYLRKQIARFNS